MSSVELRQVSKRYNDSMVVHPLDLRVEDGEFVTLLGPSGCGKTTTLRMIAGFVEPSAGRIVVDSEDITDLPPQRRGMGMVFQDYTLFPHLTVAENIAFGLAERRVSRSAREQRVEQLLELIRLPGLGGRYPSELSGGQQQRVALARAIAHPPRVLLMDEPFGALDLKLREAMQGELRDIQRRLGITTIFVTHDQTEAMNLSDRIAVMNAGRIEQLDVPKAIYRTPRTRFVADFIGKINLLDAVIAGIDADGILLDVRTPSADRLQVRARADAAFAVGDTVTLAIRPEDVQLLPIDATPGPGRVSIAGEVGSHVFLGNLLHADVRIADGVALLVEGRADELERLASRVQITWPTDRATVLAS